MKSESEVYLILRRAEIKKRSALRKGDEKTYLAYCAVTRNIKNILEIKTNSGRKRIRKSIKFNNSLI